MGHHRYKPRNFRFAQQLWALRKRVGLTQEEIALQLGVAGKTIRNWESGCNNPSELHLRKLTELYLHQHVFTSGSEQDEVRALWSTFHEHSPQHAGIFDERWLATMLQEWQARSTSPDRPTTRLLRSDWSEALDVPALYGRADELAGLKRWLLVDQCRLVSVVGMGGIGKTALAVSAMHQMAEHFEVVIFRSLRDAPSCEELLYECLQVLSPQSAVPADLERRISRLLEYLRTFRALIVLDNLEAILQDGDVGGRFRPGFGGYGRLLRLVAETEQQSCLLLTSREKPSELRPLEGMYAPVRSLRLSGLDAAACEQLFLVKGVVGTSQGQMRLAEAYGGNPLALKMVTEIIIDLFGGEIEQFLLEGTVLFGSITDLLAEQVTRLSALEQTVLRWLAIIREPATIDELLVALVTPLRRVQVLEAIDSLRRRSLIELGQRQASFTLQSVVLEYVTAALITEATNEIQHRKLDRLIQHGLEQAYAKEYVRQTQRRLLVVPLLNNLRNAYQQQAEVEPLLCSLLGQLRARGDYVQDYGPANLIVLLGLLRGHLRGLDLSQLAIRGAYFQNIEMQDASLARARICDAAFTEAFDAIWGVAISRNGTLWAAGSRRGEVRVWDQGSQSLHLVWQAHTDIVPTLAFSPDGQTLATGSWDGTVKLWDLDSGALLWMGEHPNVISLAFTPDGSMLASGGRHTGVKLWDVASGTNLQTLEHPGYVYAVTWNPDGHLLASGDFDGSIRLWEVRKTQPATCVQTLSEHTDLVMGLAFAPDGSTLASGSWDTTVKLWDVASGCVRQTLSMHTDKVHGVVWSPDGRIVASCSVDKTIWLWDVEQGNYRAALRGHTAAVYDLTFTPDSSGLLSGSEDGTLRMWDVTSGQCIRIMQGYAVSFYDVDWSPDGTQLISGSTDGLVIIWDARGKRSPRVLRGHSWIVGGVAWSPDNLWLASCEWHTAIRLWDPTSGDCVQVLRDPVVSPMGMARSPDGQLLACGTIAHGVQVWDVTESNLCWIGRKHSAVIRHVAWSPDGTRLIGGGDDGNVYLWKATDGVLLQRLSGHHGIVMNVAWSPDGTQLVSCGGNSGKGEVFVWDVQSGECVRTFAGHHGIVYAVAWSPDGKVVVSGGCDGTVRWWEVQHEECLRTRKAHHGTVQALRVSPDGHQLASSGDDSAIRLWDLHSGELVRTLRRDRPYERLNIAGIRGVTEAQKTALRALGAIEEDETEASPLS